MATFTIPPALQSSNLITSPGVTIPAGAQTATIALLMPIDAERASTSQHVDFGVELQIAPSTSWKPYLLAGWNGGAGSVKSTVSNAPPAATLGGDFFAGYAGQQARLRLQAKNPMTIGATITVV